MAIKDYHELLIALRQQDVSYSIIAEKLGYKRDSIKHYCQRHDIRGSERDLSIEARTANYIKRFNKKFPQFDYVSGYESLDSTITVRCKVCGHVQERHANSKPFRCDGCAEAEREERKRIAEIERETEEKRKLSIKIIKLLTGHIVALERESLLPRECHRCGREYVAKSLKSVHCDNCIAMIKAEQEELRAMWEGKIVQCAECGKEFEKQYLKNYYCSDRCKRRAGNRTREVRRRKKLEDNGRVDMSISLIKLYKKDRGICYICGGKCDINDYIYSDEGHFIAGGNYPSIDHVRPVSRGGTHTWDNVRLAHRICNSQKNDRMTFLRSSGQMVFAM